MSSAMGVLLQAGSPALCAFMGLYGLFVCLCSSFI